MERTTLTRRTLLGTALATTALAASSVRVVHAAGSDACGGGMVLAWHTNIAPRWLDPPQHDGGATPDNFLNVIHDALIENFREALYDHPRWPSASSLAKTRRAPAFGCARASNSTTALRSHRQTKARVPATQARMAEF